MFRFVLFSVLSLGVIPVSAQSQISLSKKDFSLELDRKSITSCFCEIGKFPVNEQFFFVLGCEVWLSRQNSCNHKSVVIEDTNYLTTEMPKNTKALKLGYVGHWDSSYHLIRYLNQSVLPIMKTKLYSVHVDNTACDAMNDPESVSSFMNSLKFEPNQSLFVRGNQNTSIGTWDILLPSSDNFIAEVSSNVDHVIFPSCRNYENKSCFDAVQKYQSGRCLGSQNVLTQLTCCQTDFPGRTSSSPPYFKWQRPENCVQ